MIFVLKSVEFPEKCAVFELNNIDDDIHDETCKHEEIIPFNKDKIVGFIIDDSAFVLCKATKILRLS